MVKIKVPASTANLGPGFDCLGLGLNLFNTFIIEEIPNGLTIEGCLDEFKNKNNLVYKAIELYFNTVGYHPKGISIKMDCNIPLSSGLGSSAACILGGLLGANEIAGRILTHDEVLNLALSLENHPDNLSAALYGGLTVSLFKDKVYVEKFSIPKGLRFYALIPSFQLSTKISRDILPKEISFKDGVSNIGSCALLIASLINGNFDLINIACNDKFHEPHRSKLIPNFYNIKEAALNFGALGVFLSGAGPTIMTLVSENNIAYMDNMHSFLNTLGENWNIQELLICNTGVEIY